MNDSSDVDATSGQPSRAAVLDRLVRSRLGRHDAPEQAPDADTDAEPGPIPMTPLQRSLWLHGERYGHGRRQLVTWSACLTGEIDDTALEAALRSTAGDGALQVRFTVLDGDLVCLPEPHRETVVFVDRSREFADLGPADREAAGLRIVADRVSEIDPAHGVFAASCVRIDANHLLIGLIAHHLVFDARSLRVFLDRLAEHYEKRLGTVGSVSMRTARLSRPTAGTGDSIAYWTEVLADRPPGVGAEQGRASRGGGRRDVAIGAPVTRALRQLAVDCHASLFMVVFVGVAIAMRRAGAPADVIIGVPVDTREPENADRIGCFVNTLPLRMRWADGAVDYRALLDDARRVVTEGLVHRDAALADISAALGGSRSASGALFDVTLNFLGIGVDELYIDGVECEPLDLAVTEPEFGLSLFVREEGSELDIVLEYSTRLLDATGTELFGELLADVFDEMANHPDRVVPAVARTQLWRTADIGAASTPPRDMATEAPGRHLQAVVADVFAIVLEQAGPLTADDDFFLLGGHSLLAMRVAMELRLRTGVDLTLADIFDYPTVGELAAVIAGHQDAGTDIETEGCR
ncbi:condensation domain-containing protein [Nocardia gipuzkoensis]